MFERGIESAAGITPEFAPISVSRDPFVMTRSETAGAKSPGGDDSEIARVEAIVGARLLGEPMPATRRIGRFVVLERIGTGGMGVVYSAYDDQLDRCVAIKLLHLELDSPRVRQRLVREAQAMARLAHPHVAAVYGIGEHGSRAFVAMELVKGRTLRQWRCESSAPWGTVLDRYLQAGRGLAAAHAAGLVHRDFKPDNALVGDDDRVRVVDFGLARGDLPAETATSVERDEGSDGLLTTSLTRTGTFVGTPAYMAPEQYRCEEAGPAADQFAFCVSLFEALYGARPFTGNSAAALYEAIVAGRIAPPPRATGVPKHVEAAVLRGLAAAPEDRWPTLAVLLDALQHDPRRRRRALFAALLVVIAVLSILSAGSLQRRIQRDRVFAACEARRDLDDVWNADASARVRAALLGSKVSYSASTAERVMPKLAAYAQTWSEADVEVCLAADGLGDANTDVLDRARWCLDERKLALQALIEQLSRTDANTTARASVAVVALAPVSACRDIDLLSRLPAPPTEHRDEVRGLRARLARVDALQRAGRYDEALGDARSTVADSLRLGWPSLTAAARNGLGKALAKSARYDEAEAELTAAYFDAMQSEALEIAVDASTSLVQTVGVQLARPNDGLAWSRHAESALAVFDDVDGLATARWLERTAELRVHMVDLEEAEALAGRAIAIREATLGADHPDVGDTVYLLALARHFRDPDGARPLAARAVAIAESALGPDHPDLVARLSLLGVVEPNSSSVVTLERAIAIGERALGPNHPLVATAVVDLAHRLYWRDGPAVAKPMFERAFSMQLIKLGSDHPEVARTLNFLGMTLHPHADAVPFYQRAIAIAEKLGPYHPFLAPPLHNLADIHQTHRDFHLAIPLMERATQVRKKVFGRDNPRYAGYVAKLGVLELASGNYERAAVSFTEALRVQEAAGPPKDHISIGLEILVAETAISRGDPVAALAAMHRALRAARHCPQAMREYADWSQWGNWVLVRTLWELPGDQGRDRARAIRLAHETAERWRTTNVQPPEDQCTTAAAELARVDAWLARHAPVRR